MRKLCYAFIISGLGLASIIGWYFTKVEPASAQTSCVNPPIDGGNKYLRGSIIRIKIHSAFTEDEIGRIIGAFLDWNDNNGLNCTNIIFDAVGFEILDVQPAPQTNLHWVGYDSDGAGGGVTLLNNTLFGRTYIGAGIRNCPNPINCLNALQSLMRHELGHTVGLANLASSYPANSSVMRVPLETNAITTCDNFTLRQVYCPSPTPTPPPPPPGDDCNACEAYCEDEGRPAGRDVSLNDGGGDGGESQFCCSEWEYWACVSNGGTWSTNCQCMTPIVIDVLGNGFNLTNAENGVVFDLANDGVPIQVSWTAVDSDDAWLALDRNGNGTIDNGRELFGSASPQPFLQEGESKHGFRALANFDRLDRGGNGDGKIDDQDEVYTSLKLWQDVNHNGVSEAGELHGLSELGLRIIDLDYQEKRRYDAHGNWFRYRSKVKDFQGHQLGRWAWDVFLQTTP